MAIPSRPEDIPEMDEFELPPGAWMALGLIILVSAAAFFLPLPGL
jgi:hypothetical protein